MGEWGSAARRFSPRNDESDARMRENRGCGCGIATETDTQSDQTAREANKYYPAFRPPPPQLYMYIGHVGRRVTDSVKRTDHKLGTK